jgi:alkylation response protein AidB-like acyl-CoA dehydrogenase
MMDLRLSEEEEQLVSALRSLLGTESTPEKVRATEDTGFSPQLWTHLLEMGIPSMAATQADTDAATLFQLALVAEECGRAVAPAPVLEACVVARLLERCGAPGRELLGAVVQGDLIGTIALGPPRSGGPRLVPSGAIAPLIIGMDGADLVAAVGDLPDKRIENLGGLPVARRRLDGEARTILSRGADARETFSRAGVDWRILSAAQLVGVAAAALKLGVDYVKTREVFGGPIGAFQTISHRLADDATAVDGARLLAYKAAWSIDEGLSDAESLASMAWCFAAETALNVSRDSLHYHGGYGFTKEYDIQLYFRRAKAYPLLLGDARREYQHLADLLFTDREGLS